jgi:hypothetical protein
MKELSVDKKNYVLTAIFTFIAGFAILFIYSMAMDIRDFPYDSGAYWGLSKSFDKNGFSFPDSIRGYVFPYFIHRVSLDHTETEGEKYPPNDTLYDVHISTASSMSSHSIRFC